MAIIRPTGPETEDEYLDRVTQNLISGAQSFDDLRFVFDAGRPPGVPYGDPTITANDQAVLAQGFDAVRARVRSLIISRTVNVGQPAPWEPDAPAADPLDEDGFAFLNRILSAYGLEELSSWAEQMLIEGHSADWIALELRNQPAFRNRFSAIFARQEAGLNPISPDEVLAYETQVRQMMRAAGLPPGFYDDPGDFVNLLTNDVSISEVADRVNEGYMRVASADTSVRQAFATMFGPSGDAALAAMFLDPEKALPALRKQVAAAEFGGAGLRFGFQIDTDTAILAGELGANQGAGRGFAALHDMRALFDETITEGTDLAAEREGVAAVFDLGNEGRDAVRRRQQERRAAFGGDAGVSVGRRGAAALGSAE